MRIVYVIGTYPLLTTTFIDREIRVLRRSGVDVRVVAARRPPPDTLLSPDQRELSEGVTYLLPADPLVVVRSNLHFALRQLRAYVGTLAYLLTRRHPHPRARLKTLLHFGEGVYAAYLMRDMGFRELHAHFADRAATIALVAGRLLGRPYSLSIHAGADIFVDPVLLREKVREARHVVTCTEHNKAHVATIAGRDLSGKITAIHHGLDLAGYRPARRPDDDPPVILSVGQLTERKGLIQLVKACRDLTDRYRFRCLIVGRGPQGPALDEAIARWSLQDRVSLLGALPHHEVIDLCRSATVFVLPCVRTQRGDVDGIPNALAEAMALEVPVVSTDLPAIRELVAHRVDGLLVPPNDHGALARAIAELLDDLALREELAAQARRTVVEMFDAGANVLAFATALWPDVFRRQEVSA